jgi:hypothetical protein
MTALSEIQIQTLFRSRARIQCPAVSIVAVPNGTHIASLAGRAKVRREGLSTGFPDVICLWAGRGFAAIEFKAAKGKVSEAQAEWLDRLTELGMPATVSRDPDHALEFLRKAGAPFMDRVGRL